MSVECKHLNSALRPESTLQWLGFTDCGTPCMQDSYGLLCLYPLDSNMWLPFCDTAKHSKNPADGFFITAVSETLQALRGIRCRGSLYPGFTPRPTLSELPIEPPFIEMATEKSQLEANLFTWSTLRVDNVEKKLKEAALKTFALACKNNLDQRALELIEMLANPQLLTLATKYATKMNRRRLSEKLLELASTMQSSEWDDSSTTVSVTPANSSVKPINKKLILYSSNKRTPKTKAPSDQEITSSPIEKDLETSDIIPASGNSVLNDTMPRTNNVVDSSINTQESVFSDNVRSNPFLKNLKKNESGDKNPLSLTDKFAGYNDENQKKLEKENKKSLGHKFQNTEKRKRTDTPEHEIPKDKQRKLEMFMFTKKQ